MPKFHLSCLKGYFAGVFSVSLASLLLAVFPTTRCLGTPSSVWDAEKHLHVGLYLDKGAHPPELFQSTLKEQKDMSLDIISGEDIRQGCLNNFDVLIVPGGSGRREAGSLETSGQKSIRKFVKEGGRYIGICAGCYLATDASPFYLGILPMKVLDRRHWRRGKATLPIEFNAQAEQILGQPPHIGQVLYHNGPILGYRDDSISGDVKTLAVFKDEIVSPKGEAGIMTNAPAMVIAKFGDGLVLGISPHPEQTKGLELLVPTAIRWMCRQPILHTSHQK